MTLLSLVDRLATRGRKAEQAITAHQQLALEVLTEALRWRADGPPEPLIRGDLLASELGIEHGPLLGSLLEASPRHSIAARSPIKRPQLSWHEL